MTTPPPLAPFPSPSPQQPSVWAAPPPGAYAGPHGLVGHQPGQRGSSRLPLWLAGAALAVALLALGLATIALVVNVGNLDPAAFSSGYTLEGDITGVLPGQVLSGDRIGHSVGDVLAMDGADLGTPSDLTCTDISRPHDGASSECSGHVDGTDWSGTVTLRGESGHYTLVED